MIEPRTKLIWTLGVVFALGLLLGGEPRHGFVEQEEIGTRGKGAGYFEPLAVPDGELLGGLVLLL